jgi:hypothetical protein
MVSGCVGFVGLVAPLFPVLEVDEESLEPDLDEVFVAFFPTFELVNFSKYFEIFSLSA